MKSTRNVILKIFPKTARVTFIKQFKSEGQIKEIPAEKVKEAAAQAKVVGSGTAKSSSQPEKKENQAQQRLLALPGYERKTRLAEIAEDRIEDMRRAVADISWYYSKSGDYKNNAAFKAGNPWGWARKDSQAAEGLVASLDEEGPDSKIIFDDEEYWFDETAEKIWRKKI